MSSLMKLRGSEEKTEEIMKEITQENLQAKDGSAEGQGRPARGIRAGPETEVTAAQMKILRSGAQESHPEGCRPAGSGSVAVTPEATGQRSPAAGVLRG